MAKQKRFYWFRFMRDFYHRREIRRLKTPLNREIYLRMCVSVIDTDDFKIHYHNEDETITDEIYFDCEMEQTGGTVEDVQEVIKLCLKTGLIESDDPAKYLYFPDMKELTGSETAKAQYMRDRREHDKNNVTQNCNNVPNNSNNVHIVRDRVIEESEKENINTKISDKETDNNKNGIDSAVLNSQTVDNFSNSAIDSQRLTSKRMTHYPSLSETQNYFLKVHSTTELAKKFYDCFAPDWRDNEGRPVRSWKSLADSFIKNQITDFDSEDFDEEGNFNREYYDENRMLEDAEIIDDDTEPEPSGNDAKDMKEAAQKSTEEIRRQIVSQKMIDALSTGDAKLSDRIFKAYQESKEGN